MVFISTDGYSYRRTECGIPSGLMNTQILDSFCNLCLIYDAMIECSKLEDEEIKEMFILVQGDDSLIFTKRSEFWIYEFLLFMETYICERWGSILNKDKTSRGRDIHDIEFLGYKINTGHPEKSIDKLVAQLLLPERRFNRTTQASRAVGMAMAATGSDYNFHQLCSAIYSDNIKYFKLSERAKLEFQRKIDPSESGELQHLIIDDSGTVQFPGRDEVKKEFRYWKGPLNYEPRWNTAHFLGEYPDQAFRRFKTMSQYEAEHDIEIARVPRTIDFNCLRNDYSDYVM